MTVIIRQKHRLARVNLSWSTRPSPRASQHRPREYLPKLKGFLQSVVKSRKTNIMFDPTVPLDGRQHLRRESRKGYAEAVHDPLSAHEHDHDGGRSSCAETQPLRDRSPRRHSRPRGKVGAEDD